VGLGAIGDLHVTRPIAPTDPGHSERALAPRSSAPTDLLGLFAFPATHVAPQPGQANSRPNYTPVPALSLPFMPAADGSPQRIEGRPSTPDDPSQHLCFETIATPRSCVTTPFQSIDFWFPEGTPSLPGL
jgi:hypothetical protein